MIGRFLEFSVYAPDVLAAVHHYERLGLRQLSVGEIWSHPYAVVSDGRAVIGLHAYEFDSPAVTFVLQSLRTKLPRLADQGIEFAFAKTGDDQFNEAGFVSPTGQMITLLEARTYSPAAFDTPDVSDLGRFVELMVPCADVAAELRYWESIGLRSAGLRETPYAHAHLAGEDVTIGLHDASVLPRRALRFACAEPGRLAMRLDDADIPWTTLPTPPAGAEMAFSFTGPDKLPIVVHEAALGADPARVG
ncbi:MAG: hypothetical protein AAF184_10900 [Pseudomonadota bacterium]